MWRVNLVARLSSITVARSFPMAQQVDWGAAPSQIPDLASDKCEVGILLMVSFLGRSAVDFVQLWMTPWRLGATTVFADYGTTDFAAWSIATWVWALIWVSNLGLDLIGWFISVMLGFVVYWIRIWDPGELLWAFSFGALTSLFPIEENSACTKNHVLWKWQWRRLLTLSILFQVAKLYLINQHTADSKFRYKILLSCLFSCLIKLSLWLVGRLDHLKSFPFLLLLRSSYCLLLT